MKRALFLVNGLGLGNSTRCHAVIQRLIRREVKVEVMTSGNGAWYFRDLPEIAHVHEMEPLYYGSQEGRISILLTLGAVRNYLRIIRRNALRLEAVLDLAKPDVVITDSVYTHRPVKRRGIPLVALNNSDVVRFSFYRFGPTPLSVRPQFYCVEMLDYMYHCLNPDLVISPQFQPDTPRGGEKFRRVGLVVREGYVPNSASGTPKKAVVMLSGSVFGTQVNLRRDSYPVSIDIVGRLPPDGWMARDGVVFHGRVLNNLELLRSADAVVVNGGYSAVAEMMYMRKPLVVIPVPRHAEQWVNARTVESLGIGRLSTESGMEDALLDVISNIDSYRAAYDSLGSSENGAEEAAEVIIEAMRAG